MSTTRLLLVDDDAGVVAYLQEMLAEEGYDTEGVTNPADALARLQHDSFDLVISDIEMPGMRGMDLLSGILAAKPSQLVMLMTAFGSVDLAVAAVKAGACDFVTKPFKIEVLTLAIERTLRDRQMRREIVRLRKSLVAPPAGDFVVHSAKMVQVKALAARAAQVAATVLVVGETGTGKGALARFIAQSSQGGASKPRPFLQLNCATLTATLMESELFGVRRGAFTDAREDRAGLFVAAHGGTLFLDEIGELSSDAQAKLLTVLESGHVRPVGATTEVAVQVRVIAATNRPLEALLREGAFRPDLYYRLNVIRIDIPPLRERREDIVPLVDLFIHQASERMARPVLGISTAALKLLVAHDWPGNVRELANTVERAVALAQHDTLLPEDFPLSQTDDALEMLLHHGGRRGMALEDVERAYVRQVVEAHQGNKVQAARALGINRRTLYRKLT